MNSFLENLNYNSSSNSHINNIDKKISIQFFNNIININNRNNYIYLELNSNNKLSQKEIDNISYQLRQVNINKIEKIKKASFDPSKENKNIKNLYFKEDMQTNTQEVFWNDKKNNNIADSLAEIKKFKTELCHSWELTGTCKYGQNVNQKFINYIIFNYSVFLPTGQKI